jgi:putative hydrolase of the HAD superfamily
MPIEIVFFDAGETLIHPYPSFHELFASVAHEAGYEVSGDTALEVQQRLAPHLFELAEETGIENPSLSAEDSIRFWSHLYRRLLGELGIEDERLVEEMYGTFSSTSSYRLFDDVLPALDALAPRYRIGLISNFEEWLEEMLVELEVGQHFDVSVISGIEGVEKPDEAIYRRAVAKAGVEPSRAAHVGDSPSNDVEPSASIGMVPVLLDRYDRYPGSDAVRIRSLSELPNLLPEF